jgi:hypothetical protein
MESLAIGIRGILRCAQDDKFLVRHDNKARKQSPEFSMTKPTRRKHEHQSNDPGN